MCVDTHINIKIETKDTRRKFKVKNKLTTPWLKKKTIRHTIVYKTQHRKVIVDFVPSVGCNPDLFSLNRLLKTGIPLLPLFVVKFCFQRPSLSITRRKSRYETDLTYLLYPLYQVRCDRCVNGQVLFDILEIFRSLKPF